MFELEVCSALTLQLVRLVLHQLVLENPNTMSLLYVRKISERPCAIPSSFANANGKSKGLNQSHEAHCEFSLPGTAPAQAQSIKFEPLILVPCVTL
jgi:hypothetical protein